MNHLESCADFMLKASVELLIHAHEMRGSPVSPPVIEVDQDTGTHLKSLARKSKYDRLPFSTLKKVKGFVWASKGIHRELSKHSTVLFAVKIVVMF